MREYIERLIEARQRAWDQAKALIDSAESEKRELTSEEDQTYTRLSEEMNTKQVRIAELVEQEKRDAEADEARSGFERLVRPEQRDVPVDTQSDLQHKLLEIAEMRSKGFEIKPEGRSKLHPATELRALSKLTAGAGANTVPTSFYDQLYAHLIEVSGIMAAGATVLNTDSGEALQVPKTTGHSTAVLTAEAAVIAASDPAFGQGTLNAFKYAVLVQLSNELLTDTGVDIEGYLAMQAGRAVGNAFGVHAIVGTGTAQPTGVVTSATVGITGSAGVAGAFTADNLIDLFYSVIAPYRNSPQAAWLMRDATMGAVRKLKDTTNQYLWQPSIQIGVPDTLFGKPVYTDPNVAAVALSAKSVLFGDFSQYLVRMVRGIRFERSDEFAFSSDLVTFRCILRADGLLIDQTGAVKTYVGNAA